MGALLSGRGIPSEGLLSGNSRGTRVRTLESLMDDLRIARAAPRCYLKWIFFSFNAKTRLSILSAFFGWRADGRVWIASKFLANGPFTTERHIAAAARRSRVFCAVSFLTDSQFHSHNATKHSRIIVTLSRHALQEHCGNIVKILHFRRL